MSIRVLIVDDSELVRRVLRESLDKDQEINVVGAAKDPLDASEKIEALRPDVLTLDLEMPEMDGMTFLRRLMRHHPMPVIIVSAYTKKGSNLAMEALESGALDIVQKPGMAFSLTEMTNELVAKIKAVSHANLNGAQGRRVARPGAPNSGSPALQGRQSSFNGAGTETISPPAPRAGFDPKKEPVIVLPALKKSVDPMGVIVIGSSTGGTQALQYLLGRLPGNMPPILIVQHMPPGFTKTFADRLDSHSQLHVKEAEPNDIAAPGQVLIAQGSLHMVLKRVGSKYKVELNDGPKVSRQRPSVEVLFQSAARVAGKHALGVILTGMGADGAQGMLAMNQAGATTIAEDEKSCVVFGMPKEAIKLGGVDHVVHLKQIPEEIVKYL